MKFSHLQKSIKRNQIFAPKLTTFIDRMSEKEFIFKKSSYNLSHH